MQGRYIEHQALKAIGGRERISMVTSFRPKSALARDETVVSTLRGITPASVLAYQYAEYRLENLEERIREQLRVIRRRQNTRRDFDIADATTFLVEQKGFIEAMLVELEKLS